jgi:sugar phosphate isomerase/epimerase
MNPKIGFMQGRLSPLVDGRIQSFPWGGWKEEFYLAGQNGYQLIEWTLDQKRINENPIMYKAGRKDIASLMNDTGVGVESVTGDCFMQAPFWRAKSSDESDELVKLFVNIVQSCSELGVKYLVVPLVDEGSLTNLNMERYFIDQMHKIEPLISKLGLKICFESDYRPSMLLEFIGNFDSSLFGINYDIGNSAAMGIEPSHEVDLLNSWILNVHVKDRLLNGTTVPLGEGVAQFSKVFSSLNKIKYDGNLILQTARAKDGSHLKLLNIYREQVLEWLSLCSEA